MSLPKEKIVLSFGYWKMPTFAYKRRKWEGVIVNKTVTIVAFIGWCVLPANGMEVASVSVEADKAQIEEWLEQGGRLFSGMEGVEGNVKQAVLYYKLVLNHTTSKEYLAQAHVNLGEIFYAGASGVPIDEESAYNHYTAAYMFKADSFATVAAALGLGRLFLWGLFVNVDYGKALAYLQLVAEQEEFPGFRAHAKFLLGEMHLLGLGIKVNPRGAQLLFEQVLAYGYAQSSADACWRLGELMCNEAGGDRQKVKEGFAYLVKATEQRANTRAQRAAYCCMAKEYASGKSIKLHPEKACELYSWVVNQKGKQDFDQWALIRLAELLCKKNKTVEARYHLMRAAQQQICKGAANKAHKSLVALDARL
jgi:TPR repeat protein